MARKNRQTTSSRIFSELLLIAAGIFAFSVSVPAASAASITPSSVIEFANRDRVDMGLVPLTENAKLSAAAREKAKDMIKNDYFAHTSPAGRDPWYWIRSAGYSYKAAGENLAINYETAKEQEKAWMKSSTHRANILNARYTETGVAVMEGKIDGETSLVTVQLFAQPAVAVTSKSAPAPVVQEPAPAIKGVGTEQVPTVPAVQPVLAPQMSETVPEEQSLPTAAPQEQVLPAAPEGPLTATASSSDGWYEEAWYVAFALLIVSVLLAPIPLFAKSISAIASHFWEEELLHAAYRAAAMTAALDAHIRAPDIQHSG